MNTESDVRPLLRRLGKPQAKPLAPDEARALMQAMLAGTLDEVQLGAAWMGLRIKGETPARTRRISRCGGSVVPPLGPSPASTGCRS